MAAKSKVLTSFRNTAFNAFMSSFKAFRVLQHLTLLVVLKA